VPTITATASASPNGTPPLCVRRLLKSRLRTSTGHSGMVRPSLKWLGSHLTTLPAGNFTLAVVAAKQVLVRRCRWPGKTCPGCGAAIQPGQQEARSRTGQPLPGWVHVGCLIEAQRAERGCGCARAS
jgi:hypothetical protein